MERTACLHGRGSTCQSALSLGSVLICRLLEGLAARQALQISSDQDVLCAVTCCLLEAVLSCAPVHHAATSSHGGTILDIKKTLNPNMYVTPICFTGTSMTMYVRRQVFRPYCIVYRLGHGGESPEYLTLVRHFAWQDNQSNCCICRDFPGDDPYFLMMTYIG